MDVSLRLDETELARILKLLSAFPEHCNRAIRRGVLKAAKRLAVASKRNVSDALKVTRMVMNARLRTYRKSDGISQKVWLGMNALAAARLGKARQTNTGVQVGQHFFEKAFIINRFGGGVYKRVGKERFPLEMAKLEIDAAGEAAMMKAYADADGYLLQYIGHEIEWELSKL